MTTAETDPSDVTCTARGVARQKSFVLSTALRGAVPRRIRVGIADDDPVVRFTLAHALNRYEDLCVVAAVEDGAEGVRLAEGGALDVLVLDLNMPVMDGWEALRQIRLTAPSVRVVMHSSEPAATRAEDLKTAGAAAYVQKGGKLSEVAAIVRKIAAETN